ncbi:agmatine deiminase family protein [Sphingomonas sp.]|uniref:agmatine deiminase family protein n=1 Tax=Sphingomonas sp. TaxID=28214 RepID=UPI0025ED90ED|nr:agmatine deiminase family protein [Sphingomonas sp.]
MPHFPAEWSPHAAVWIGFPSDPDLWLDDLKPAQAQVAAFARAVRADGKGEIVRLVCANEAAADSAVAMKTGAEIHLLPFYDIWLRDTGPLVVREDDGLLALDYRGNGWGGKYPSPLDDAIGGLLAVSANLAHGPRSMILEGGAIDLDGAGLLVTTEQCLLNPNRNPLMSRAEIEAQLTIDLGVNRVLWLGDGLAADHTDGHVDNLARFVAPGLLALPEPEGRDDPNADLYADAWARARDFGVEVVPLPSPGLVTGDDGIVAASYMNFYIGNAAVVVPTHGAANDDAAVKAIAALFPDRLVTGLRTDHILTGGGSFHCISQQVPRI